jgi:Ca2+-transporting ATPase
MAAPEIAWHTLRVEEVVQRLETDPSLGLPPAEAARRLALHGPNRLPEEPPRPFLRLFLDQFANVLVALLVGAAALTVALGEWTDALAIGAIVLLNAFVGALQEHRAAGALEALRGMTSPVARVRRGGEPGILPAADLVPGDLVVLEAGDRIPADLRLLRASAFRTVEAALTGEPDAVEKDAGACLPAGTPLPERATSAYLGTVAADGVAEGVVTATGLRTEFGRIADLVRRAEPEETPLQVRLREFGRWLAVGAAVVVGLVFLLGLLRRVPFVEMLWTSVSLAVAAVPEGLPAVVTVALSLGVSRMAKRKAIVRRLAAVETLGCVTVIGSDKTGTLTEGKMSLVEVDGDVPRRELLRAAVACSTARLAERDGRVEVAGDPMEGAILLAARGEAVEPEGVELEEPTLSLQPFDPRRKRMAVVRSRSGRPRVYAKGAPEVLLPDCALGPEERSDRLRRAEALARRGLRVLAVAEGDDGGPLGFAGLVAFRDPPRAEARAAVEACRRAGIRPLMITGDAARTAMSVAAELGIAGGEEELATGADLDAWDDAELGRRAGGISVYARVTPEHKLRIVRAWKARGAVVAMTGDGVNDAPALKGADIGVAMGKSGTDVARGASAMILADDNFATLVAAVEQGRVIYENIRKTMLYLLSGNAGEILVMAVAVLAGLPLPLLPIHLLWINLVTDGLPALALATDAPDGDLLTRPPRKPGERITDRDFLWWMLSSAVLTAACPLAAFVIGLRTGSLDTARTYAFTVLVAAEALRVFALRSRRYMLPEIGIGSNLRLVAVSALTLGLHALALAWEPLRGFLRMTPISGDALLVLVPLALTPITLLELWKPLRRLWPRVGSRKLSGGDRSYDK